MAIAHGEDAPAKDAPSGPSPAVTPGGDTGVSQTPTPEEEKPKLPWHGSIAFFDQSVSTQTIGLGKDFQSADNIYELWFSVKPKYFVFETKTNNLSLNLWANLTLEMTNNDATTTSQEPVVGPTWVWASYAYIPVDRGGYKTTLSIGPRLTLPTEKAARNSGQIIVLGGLGGLVQTFPIAGKDARAFNGGRLGVSGVFDHPLSRGTEASNPTLAQPRQDVGGRLIQSDQLSGASLTRNSSMVSLSA